MLFSKINILVTESRPIHGRDYVRVNAHGFGETQSLANVLLLDLN